MSQPAVAPNPEAFTTRVVAHAPSRVLHAITDPTHLAHWWGPAGFTNSFREIDVRPGGAWRFTMHGPDGQHYPNESEFIEVGPERVVIRHLSGHRFTLTISLDTEGTGTRIGWRQVFDEAAECERVRVFIEPANEQNLDRLEDELAAMP
ncbi:SRPBCC family protein [Variovorax ureilyticus]|uniref:SRPBCC family protein n=1 Tax=Variovorax ureilyticus TaxID=1836198 RepID=A0ABU8VBG3_9BURK